MATIQHKRIMAILLQNAYATLYSSVLPGYSLTVFWNVSSVDDDLPAEGEVKAVLDQFKTLSIPALSSRPAETDVSASQEGFEGLFTVPATSTLVPFVFSGPVFGGQSQAQGFGVALTVQRLTVFVQAVGASGVDLTLDIKLDGVSILTAPITIPAGSGDGVGVIVPPSQLATTAIPASGVVSAHILTAPDDSEGVAINLWVKPQ